MGVFLGGIAIGVWLVVGVIYFVPTPTLDAAKKAISECEKNFPRNVTCELYAKAKVGEEK